MELGLRLADPGLERRSVRRRLACALFATTALVAASPAAAQVTTWQAGTGSWFVGGNWDNGVPTNADITNVFNGGTAQIAGPAAEAQSLTIRGGSTVDVQAGGSLVVGLGGVPIGFITINTGGGTLLLSGSTAVNATRLVLDDDNATLRAGTTGTFNVPTIWLGTGRTPTIAATAGNILTLTGDIQFFDNATARFGSVTDTGTVVLNPGAVTVGFTPAIEVAGGSLRAANSNALPTQAAVTVNSGATLQIDPGGVFSGIGSLAGAGFVAIGAGSSLSAGFNGTSTTFSGAITGGGSFEYSGAGTLALTGANTIGGNLTICNCATGVLDINGGSFIVGGVTTVFDGTLQVSNGGVLTTAGLTRIGAADPAFMTILSGGVVNSQGGALIDAATGTPTATVSGAGSTWNVTGGLTIGNALFGGVANLIAADGGVVNSDTTTIGPGSTLNLGTGALAGAIVTSQIANGGAIVANFTDTLTLAAAITGAGTLTKQGPGTLILTGASTYTGATNVTGGILNVNGSLVSTVNVNAGTLMGTGAIGGLLNNGTVAPGNSIGTLTVNGNATFNSGGVYQVEFSPAAADRINVTGTATLGGTVQAVALPGSFSPRTYTILNAAGGVTGTFSNLTVTGAPGAGNAQLGYDANNVFLQIDPSLISPQLPTGTPRNPAAVANSIDRAVLGGATPPPAFDALFNFSGAGLVNALTQLSGEVAAGFRPASHLSMGLFLNAMLDPFVGGRNRGFGAANAYAPERQSRGRAQDAFAAAMPVKAAPQPATFDNRWAVWGTAYGGRTRTDGDPVVGSSDLTDSAAGFTAGADYKVSPTLTLGAAVAIGETRWNVGFGSGNSNLGQIGGYAAAQWNSFYLSAALAGAWHNAETERTVAVAGLERLEADFDATMFGARLEGGWRHDIGRFGVIPHAAFQVQRVHTSAYGERATIGPGDFALNYAAQTVTDTRTELGLWADTAHALANGAILTLRARAAWMHDFDPQTRVNAVFQALPGSNFTVEGAASARDAALLSAAGELQLANGVTLLARFDGEFSGRATMYGGTGTVRYQW